MSAPPPVLLVHGFAADARMWQATGWTGALERAGRRWIAPDLLGHGARERPRDPSAYRVPALLDDLLAAVDGDASFDVVGYSLGGELALELAAARPQRVRRLVAGGIGARRPVTPEEADELLGHVGNGGPAPAGPAGALWAMAQAFAGGDACALAACLAGIARSPRPDAADLGRFRGPALLFAGAEDPLADGIAEVAAALPGGELLEVPGRDHRTAPAASAVKRRAVQTLCA